MSKTSFPKERTCSFYSYLIEIDSILFELDQMDLSDKEKEHLISLVDTSLHNTILDVVLSELSDSDKRVFLTKLTCEDNSRVWEFLNQRVDKIEDKIKKAAEDLKNELHQDIKEAHNLRKER